MTFPENLLTYKTFAASIISLDMARSAAQKSCQTVLIEVEKGASLFMQA